MLFREDKGRVLAISQPQHAWISGQLLRQFAEPLSETLYLAGEQHDIGWLHWEIAPSFNPVTGRPLGFREMPATIHAPMWRAGVDAALQAYGRAVALLVSRHGGGIYRRFARPTPGSPDAAAIENYLTEQGAREAEWMAELGLDESATRRQSAFVAFVDALSLVLCGDLKPPLELDAPTRDGVAKIRILADPSQDFGFRLSPWPFEPDVLTLAGEGVRLPDGGRYANDAEFRSAFPNAPREEFRSVITAG